MLDDINYITYYDDKFNEIPKEFLEKCTTFIKENITLEAKEEIARQIGENGLVEWALPHHHYWGMGIRNLFRGNGFLDENLPDGNWDDYYIQVIEHALGYR